VQLQSIMFPDSEAHSVRELYYRSAAQITQKQAAGAQLCCILDKGEVLSFDTYFNSFSVGKWATYSLIRNLRLEVSVSGVCEVALFHVALDGDEITRVPLSTSKLESRVKRTFSLDFPALETRGLFYFTITALEGGTCLYKAAYATDEALTTTPPTIAIGICTYRREAYLEKNLTGLRSSILDNPASPLKDNLSVFISDNGQTLTAPGPRPSSGADVRVPPYLQHPSIHVFPNRNQGGSGGFARVMMEVKDYQDRAEHRVTHILLMDDDIDFDPQLIERIFNFLQFLKPEHRESFLGGAMLMAHQPCKQTEIGGRSDAIHDHSVKSHYDLCDLNCVLDNELEEEINYFGWWCCCMPASILRDDNLPLPLFIKKEDIEFSLRNNRELITLNGVCVWHESFFTKSSTHLRYYWLRNLCITSAIHHEDFQTSALQHLLTKYVIKGLLQYRYLESENTLRAVEDFLKGIDWLKTQDPEKLNQTISTKNYPRVPIDEVCPGFDASSFGTVKLPAEKGLHKFLRKLVLNGWLLPARKDSGRHTVVPTVRPKTRLFFRARAVIHYNAFSGEAYVTEKNYRTAFAILRRYLRVKRMVNQNFQSAASGYRERYRELCARSFWETMLYTDDFDTTIKRK